MKPSTIAVGATILIGGIWAVSNIDFAQVYKAETVEKIIDNTPEWATDPDAVKAAEEVIRRKELEAELESLNQEIDERQQRVDEIEKELGTY